ncbi:hypothetical protein MAR_018535 [Mya arenaria]|uniref:Uncharacterized protein n=1 Tax=Mya arenaria TaxID=6604 RepID=A0ABY7EI50_MYAAR|nr:hypothetical protein MAR_018535 [Mya arenaria]
MQFYNQMPGPSNRGTKKKRQSRALKRTYKRIETLEDQNETLKRKLKTAQKRIERFEQSKGKKATTPRRKTDSLLKCCGIHPEQATENNTIAETPNEIRKLKSIITGKVVKKYRLRKYLQDMTALGRRKLISNKRTNTKIMRSRAEKVKRDVFAFLMRGDNSRVMPGKGDTVTVGREKKTKRILNDYLQNLHLKIIAENEYRISKASFCRHRPKELTLVNFASRNICLCVKHQNISFKLRSLKNMSVTSSTSPDIFVDMNKSQPEELDKLLSAISQERVKYQQWKRVKMQSEKERMRIVDIEMACQEFVDTMKKEFTENRSIFDLVYNFERTHGCKASWHYFESGHGKSACDGVGGTAKRNADMAVKQSKAVIQDANDFYAWAKCSQSEIEYLMVTQEEYDKLKGERKNKARERYNVSTRSCLRRKINHLLMRTTSCVCQDCFGEDGFNAESNSKWDKVTLKFNCVRKYRDDIPDLQAPQDAEIRSGDDGDKVIISVSDFAVAEYEGTCYIGQVLEIDNEDDSRFKWPTKSDKIWVDRDQIYKRIEDPKATGKGGRICVVPDKVVLFMEQQNSV